MSGRHFLEKGMVVEESTRRRRAIEDSTDSSVDEEWIRGLGLEGETSERTTTESRSKGPVRGRQLGVRDGRSYQGNSRGQKFFFRK